MRKILIALLLSLGAAMPTLAADVHVSIGINVPVYPTLVRVPSYPVYYAPSLRANYFFYDGLYWVYHDGVWYDSPWYNGPWYVVDRFDVPVYLLRVPVRYYSVAPAYFRAWSYDAPPLWGQLWGPTWEERRVGWDTWNRASVPAAAPLPVYQRAYSGPSYPVTVAQQAVIQQRSYSYQPREAVARQQFQERRVQAKAAPQPTRTTQQVRLQEPKAQQAKPQRERVQQVRAQPQRQEQVKQVRAQPQRQEQVKQARAQPKRQEPVKQARAQPKRQEHVQQARAQPQRQEHAQQVERKEQHAQRQQPHENRGAEKGRGKDKDDHQEKG